MMTTLESIKETVKRELPAWLESDPSFRAAILDMTSARYARREETDDWFRRALDDMRRERERQDARWRKNDERLERERQDAERKWEEHNRKWEANQAELKTLREEQERKWNEQNRKWDEQNRKWDEQNRKWDETQAETRAEFQRVHEEIMAAAEKNQRGIGALGARWGMQSEATFRNALAGILERSFDVQVRNVTEYDALGTVFGRPDQVELDVIIHNGTLILCELKSSIDKAGMYVFERKARFYERQHGRPATRLLVISPMVDPRARPVAEALGIEIYSDSVDVKAL